jgi:hypothetical protein
VADGIRGGQSSIGWGRPSRAGRRPVVSRACGGAQQREAATHTVGRQRRVEEAGGGAQRRPAAAGSCALTKIHSWREGRSWKESVWREGLQRL